MNKGMKLRAMSVFVALLLAAACSSESNQNQTVTTTTNTGASNAAPAAEVKQRGNALVRVIHAVPGGTSVDVFSDDAKVFSGVAYKTTSPYKEVSGERHTFRIRPAGQDTAQPLAENSDGLGDGRHYTVVAWAGTDGKPALSIVDDDLVPPPSGKAKVRLIHASAGAGEVDVYAREGNKKLLGGVEFQNATSYSEVDPMGGTIEVRPAGKTNSVLTIPNVKFDAGNTYTIVILGKVSGTPRLEAMIVEDRLVSTSTTALGTNANRNANGNVNGNANGHANKNANRY